MRIRPTLTAAIIAFAALTGFAQGPTLRDLVRSHDPNSGTLFVTLNATMPSLSVPQLLADADLVLDGTIEEGNVSLTPDERYIVTIYTVLPNRILFARTALAARSVSVVHIGGEMTIDGQQVTMQNATLREFGAGERLVLFLKGKLGDSAYDIHGGPYGSFAVRSNRMFSLVSFDDPVKRPFEGTTVDEFAALLGRLAANLRQ